MNGIPRISEAAKRYRLNGYRDGRAGTAPNRVGRDYTDGYRRGRAYLLRHTNIEAMQSPERGSDE